MKILFLDIETAPTTASIWKIWQENIGLKQIQHDGHIICWAAKWYGEGQMMYDSIYQSSPKDMLRRMHRLMDKADVVVHFYGTRFDVPTLNAEFVKNGMLPPSPFKQVDLKKVCKDNFKLISYKLEYVVKYFGVGRKIDTDYTLWEGCLKNDPKSWVKMEKYNKHDTALLEGLYKKLRPWIKNHPNHGAHTGKLDTCPTCGGKHLQRRGTRVVRLLRYPQFACQTCGTWFRSNQALPNRKKVYRHVSI